MLASEGAECPVITCGIYQTDAPGFYVRLGFSEDDQLRAQRPAESGSARELASEWRVAVLAKAGFVDLDAPS